MKLLRIDTVNGTYGEKVTVVWSFGDETIASVITENHANWNDILAVVRGFSSGRISSDKAAEMLFDFRACPSDFLYVRDDSMDYVTNVESGYQPALFDWPVIDSIEEQAILQEELDYARYVEEQEFLEEQARQEELEYQDYLEYQAEMQYEKDLLDQQYQDFLDYEYSLKMEPEYPEYDDFETIDYDSHPDGYEEVAIDLADLGTVVLKLPLSDIDEEIMRVGFADKKD